MSYLPKSCHAFHMASLRMRDLTLTNDEVDHASSCFNMVRYVDMVAVANYMYIDVFATPFKYTLEIINKQVLRLQSLRPPLCLSINSRN